MRALLVFAIVLVLFAARLAAQHTLHEIHGTGLGGQYGLAVDGGGDANADGVRDLLIGAPLDSTTGIRAGRVDVISGADGSKLWYFWGAANDQLGFAVAWVGDLNFDGHDDFAMGAPGHGAGGSGQVLVYSGKTMTSIATITPLAAGGTFGRSLAKIGFVDAIHPTVFAVGAPYEDGAAGTDAGAVYVYTGNSAGTGIVGVSKVSGPWAGERFGWSISGADVFGASGPPHVVAGAPYFDQSFANQGRVRVFHPVSGAIAYTKNGAGEDATLGYAVAGLRDVNVDGNEDFAAGSPFDGAGVVRVFSGFNGAQLMVVNGPAAGSRFGTAIAGRIALPPLSYEHMAVGAPLGDSGGSNTGSITLYRVAGGAALAQWTIHGAAGEQLGAALAASPSAPSADRLVVGGPSYDGFGVDSGLAHVLDAGNAAELMKFEGLAIGEQLGTSVCSVGDVNGDGVPDYGVGAPRTYGSGGLGLATLDAGSGQIRSGADGAVLRTLGGSSAGDALGTAIAGTGDVNGDGVPDWIVGAPLADSATTTDAGEAFVRSGAGSATLFALNGFQSGSEFGAALAGGDVNHDGTPDFAVGMPGYANGSNFMAGRMRVISGANGSTVLMDKSIGAPSEHFGDAVAMGDLDADGWCDVVVGIPERTVTLAKQGQVSVYSGKTGAQTASPQGTVENARLGRSVAVVGDVNADGILDFAAGAPFAGVGTIGTTGYVTVRSGVALSGQEIWQWWGEPGDLFGTSVSGAGDVDLDGHADVWVGASQSLGFGFGFARLYSGATGASMHSTVGTVVLGHLGAAAAGIGDANGDGIPDAVVGSPDEGPPGVAQVQQGAARLVSLKPAGVAFYGASTPGCAGAQLLTATSVPKVNTPGFGLSCNHAPASALGLLLICSAQDAAGTNFLGLGVQLHVDLLASTFLVGLNMTSDAAGYGFGAAPIPDDGTLGGITLYAQALWAETACALPPFNLSATSAVAYTIQ